MGWIGFILGPLLLLAGYALGRASPRRGVATPSPPERPSTGPGSGPGYPHAAGQAASAEAATPPDQVAPATVRQRLPVPDPKQAIYAVAQGAHEDYHRATQPAHLIGASGFEDCVEAMRTSPLSNLDLLGFYTGESVVFAVCAAEALARRPPDPVIRERLLRSLNDFHLYTRFFGLRAITAATPAAESVVGLVLPVLDDSWDIPPLRAILADFVAERIAAGDPPRLEALRGEPSDDTCALLEGALHPLDRPEVAAFLDGLARLRAGRVDIEFLRSIGTVGPPSDGIIVEHRGLLAARDAVTAAVTGTPPRPVLLVGSPGSGRTTLMQAVWRELRSRGWNLFRAGHAELIADQSYVGQIESRMRRLLAELGRSRRVLWVAPSFQAFIFAGRFRGNPTGLLDLVLPGVVDGQLPFVGITEPTGLDLLIRNKPEILTSFEIVRLDPLPEAEALAIARAWDRERSGPPAPFGEPLLREASHLAQQYLGDMATPGSLIQLLKMVCRDLADDAAAGAPADAPAAGATATLDDLITCVGRMTRLPASILDERQMLETGKLTAFFTARVIGQPEAVETLVERVAMIKAGVTDPTRPLGVFLFAGPTGTGKTEIAKALAEYLCGSPARLVRVDMSELQAPESLGRLLGEGTRDVAGNALVDAVRRNPFSVVLLDEFEKSHPQVWDLFLQVFDDGRLTDLRGMTVNFRNCVIILTSNLGSTLPTGPGLGFGGTPRPPAESVERAVERAFRREFFNRIDRVVVFRPLSRDVLREILHKELRDVFERRGLRNRGWVVVWDETAIDFLLERGTTPDLGARPLKRAIERHVLAPLARTIVEHQYPQGDQFLFVRRVGDRLDAEFVDPDAEPATPADDAATVAAAAAEPARLEALALDPRGGDDEIPCLERHLADLVAAIDDDDWHQRKRTTLERQQEPGFWDSPERFTVFGWIEQMDRVEAGVRSAASLFEKLRGAPSSGRTRFAGEHAGRLALRLFLLGIAVADVREARPLDAFLSIEAADAGDPQRAATAVFIARLTAMYRSWAERRGLKCEALVEDDGGVRRAEHGVAGAATGATAGVTVATAISPAGGGMTTAAGTAGRSPRVLLAISGLAAHTLLRPESGLHLFEEPAAVGTGYDRVQVRVRVAAQPEVPPAAGSVGLRAQALCAVEAVPATPQIVRRYRERPSPLVRDSVRGWRTGRIDRVDAGDFDLLVAVAEPAPARPGA